MSLTPSSPHLPPVLAVAGWVLQRPLGTGGLAEVWSAVGPTGERAAVKLMRPGYGSASDVRRFLREGRLLAEIETPGLPRCISYGADPLPHIIMEELEGKNLAEYLVQFGPMSSAQTLRVAEELLQVVAVLHRHGVIHRDIKPANVFVRQDGSIRLMDLGLARSNIAAGTTTLGDVLGTWSYMAPEQLVGADVDARCDLFSVGVTLYETLSGHHPVETRSPVLHLEHLRDGMRVPLRTRVPDAPERLVQTIEQLMAWDPDARPANASLARALVLGERNAHHGHNARLVGRAAAQGAIEAALDGQLPVVLLGGPGSGLARVQGWAIHRALFRRFEVVNVRATEGAALDAILAQLSRFANPIGTSVSHITRMLAAQNRESPLFLVIEGADHIGPHEQQDLARVLHGAGALAVLITAEEDPTALPGYRVPLRPMSPIETDLVVAQRLGASAPPAGLSASIHHLTGGQPGLVAMTVRELIARGALWTDGMDETGHPRWRLDRGTPLSPAAGLARIYGTTLSSIPHEGRRLLDVLAVARQAVPLDVALWVAQVPRGAAVGPLVDAGLIHLEHHGESEVVTLRRTGVSLLLRRQLGPEASRALHARLADGLEAAPDAIWHEPSIRWHRAHGTPGHAGLEAMLSLGEDLRLRGQLGAAADLLQEAADRKPAPDIAAHLTLALGRVMTGMSRWKEAQAWFLAARDYAFQVDNQLAQAEANIGLSWALCTSGDSLAASETIERVIDNLSRKGPSVQLGEALLVAAELHRRAAHPEAAQRLIQRAYVVATHIDDPFLSTRVAGGEAALLIEAGRVASGRALLEEQADHLRFTGRTHMLVPVLYRLCIAHRREGRIDRALEVLEEADDVCRYAQQPHDHALTMVGRASILMAVHDLDGADAALEGARVAGDPDAPAALRMAYRDIQVAIRLARGDHAAALASAQVAEAEAVRVGFAADAAFHLGMVGVLTADGDAIDDALAVLDSAGDRRLATRLLLTGAEIGRDAQVLHRAEAEARASGDRFLLLQALHASGSGSHRTEARAICLSILPYIPARLQPRFLSSEAVQWADLPQRHHSPMPSVPRDRDLHSWTEHRHAGRN